MCQFVGLEGIEKAEKVCRKIVLLEDGSEVRNFAVDIKPFMGKRGIDVSLLLRYLGEKGATIQGYVFQFLLNPKEKVNPLQEQICFDIEFFAPHVIKISREPILSNEMIQQTLSSVKQPENDDHNASQPSDQNEKQESHKIQSHNLIKRKEKQRKIQNTIQNVKVWRGMYDISHHKISLIEVAKMLKISKKSLDDYYLQIRLGQLYNFDFTNNLDKGIGVLRSFIKAHSSKQMQAHLPKIIRSYDLVREYDELKKVYIHPIQNEINI